MRHPDVTTTEQGQSYYRRRNLLQLKNLIFIDMLAVISNQHLTKNNIRRKAGKCKTAHSSPPDYETRNIVSTSDEVSCTENDERIWFSLQKGDMQFKIGLTDILSILRKNTPASTSSEMNPRYIKISRIAIFFANIASF